MRGNPWSGLKRGVAKSAAKVLAALLLVLAGVAGGLQYCTAMPGASFAGTPPALDADARRVAAELERIVHGLSVGIGERRAGEGDSLLRAARYLEKELSPLTAEPGVTLRREPLVNVPHDAANLVLDLPGQKSTPLVVIGAHYDSAPAAPRRNDNASGSAAAVVLATRLSLTKHALPLRIVLFANEECPTFRRRPWARCSTPRLQKPGSAAGDAFARNHGLLLGVPHSRDIRRPSHFYPDAATHWLRRQRGFALART